MAELRCYHHCNCEDRPAVAKCTRCGKGLCRDCADKLRSEETGDILCVDCLNAEMAADVNWAMQRKKEIKKEIIFIIVGFILGTAIEIVLLSLGYMALFFLSFILFFPTLLASFGTIIKTVRARCFGIILSVLFFLILCVASPIMFIVRIVRKVKQIKIMKRFAVVQAMKYEANEQYAKATRQMSTRLQSNEEFEKQMVLKYGVLLKNNQNQAEAEKLIAEERAKRLEAEKKQAESEQQAIAAATQVKALRKENDDLKVKYEKVERRANANNRSKDKVSSGRRAA